MRIALLGVLFLVTFQISAQRLENIRAESINGGEKVVITYDINGGNSDTKYNVKVYGSHNNFSTSLTAITGDVNNVSPGTNRRIEWNAKSEISDFAGDITFELRADAIVTAANVNTPSGVKKGKTTNISWSGGSPGDNIKLELVKSGVVVQQIANTTSTGNKFTWSVPSDTEKGSDYQVRLTSPGGISTSNPFAVKSKLKAWVIIVPAAVVAGVVVFLVTKKSGGGGKDNNLPIPPDPE